jgi:hypothetical protein
MICGAAGAGAYFNQILTAPAPAFRKTHKRPQGLGHVADRTAATAVSSQTRDVVIEVGSFKLLQATARRAAPHQEASGASMPIRNG